MVTIIEDIKPRIFSGYVEAPFNKGKKILEQESYRIISLKENAKLRMQEGRNSYISLNSNLTKEAAIYLLDERIFLTKNSPIIANPDKATKNINDFGSSKLTSDYLDYALKDSIRIFNGKIPTDRFGDEDITVFAFEDIAQDYGLWLKTMCGIEQLPISLSPTSYKFFVRQIFFRDLKDFSMIDGTYRGLNKSTILRGIKEKN